ncbi:Uncharacterized protein ALO75_00978 [Pseudomonas syringae pv. coryli]|uniref:Uncharacterized protein n=1 Tax=Pseudomonas syringae pv. coryli TaxID=317659 RepID=A0A0P9N284_9PSED|nr:Uncharacterized protein ALO75_00978 [Pseudomonas syringae pv. coryli]
MGHSDQIALAELFNGAHRQTSEGRRVERADVDLAVADEIIGAAAMKGLFRVRHEKVRGTAAGSTCQVRAVFENLVQTLAIIGRDVFYVARILVAPFDLERAHAGVHQSTQVGALVVVFHRQQMLFEGHNATLIVLEGVRQAAGLRAVTTVGAAAVLRVGNIALPGERHTQRAVDEEFDGRVGLVGDCADFLQIQFAGQHQLRETGLIEKLGPAQGANIGLRTGVQFDGRNVHFHHPEVLHDQRVHAGVVELVNQLARRLQFVVMEDGVDGGEDPRVIAVREFDQLGNVTDLVAGVVPRTEARPADIDRIGTMQDGFTGDGHIPCRAEQFQVVLG